MNSSFHWAPDFVASTTHGPIAFHEWAGISWVILFSALKENATWAAELAQVDRMKPDWERARTKTIGLLAAKSTALRGAAAGNSENSCEAFNAPVISDPNRRVLSRFVYSRSRRSAAARPVFIIDPHKRLRLTITYPEAVVRDFREILGIVDSLRTAHERPADTGVDWLRTDEFVAARFAPKSAYHEPHLEQGPA